jgi:hypothetical protein
MTGRSLMTRASRLEDELEYFHDVMPPPEEDGAAEIRWWSPEPQGLQSEEEDEEENSTSSICSWVASELGVLTQN